VTHQIALFTTLIGEMHEVKEIREIPQWNQVLTGDFADKSAKKSPSK